jgi:superfamily II DNA/RNA helicase
MPEERTVFLGRCPDAITEEDVRAHYAPLGPDAILSILFPRPNGVFKGFGHVTFGSAQLAAEAAAMPPPRVAGRTLVVSHKSQMDAGGKRVKKLLREWEGTKRARVYDAVDADTVYGVVNPIPLATFLPADLVPYRRDFSSLLPTAPDPAAAKAFRKAHGFKVKGAPAPIQNIEEVEWPAGLLQNLPPAFRSPTPLQAQLWSMILSGRDCIVTGLRRMPGRFPAYVLPAVVHVKGQRRVKSRDGPVALVVTLERATAEQGRELLTAVQMGLRAHAVFPGRDVDASRLRQAGRLVGCVDVVLGTPGRLHDLLEAQALPLRRCSLLVLDGLDSLVTSGFRSHLANVISQTRPDRQTVLLLEEHDEAAVAYAETLMRDPLRMTLTAPDPREGAPGPTVLQKPPPRPSRTIQRVHICPTAEEKRRSVVNLAEKVRGRNTTGRGSALSDYTRTMVVCNSREETEAVGALLHVSLPGVHHCHTRTDAADRAVFEKAMADNPQAVLVVSAKLLETLQPPILACIINYDLPPLFSEYLRRLALVDSSGQGTMYSFFDPEVDRRLAGPLIGAMNAAKCIPPKELFQLTDLDL